ncbi:MAG: zinc-dependent alcohol dehydrogenase family protein [Pseudomonadales bacterium]|nr:zinc-dependent alcohol dehydrogenase family protein [Pseudomonadales bacterium]
MKTRAAILTQMGAAAPYAVSKPLEIAEIELSPPGPGEVLVRMRAAGLCHSDLSVIDGNRPRPMPMVLGHEGAGVVEQLGEGVRALVVGDHVVTAFVPSCGHCEPCAALRPALCEPGAASNTAGTLLSGARRLRRPTGEVLNHHLGVSAFAELATVAAESLVKVDRTLPFDEAAVFGCAVMTGVGAVINTAALPRGSSVAVIGLGGVGLAALLGARLQEARTLIAIDLSDTKLALARELGATHTFNAGDPDCLAAVRETTQGGVEFAFEMAGSAKAMELAYKITRRGGTTVTAGLSHPNALFSVPHVGIVAEERTIKGSYLGSAVPRRDIPRFIEWYQAGRLPVKRLLSEHLVLADINAAFDRLAQGQGVRQIVQFP